MVTRFPGFAETLRVLRRGICAVALGGMLGACAGAEDGSPGGSDETLGGGVGGEPGVAGAGSGSSIAGAGGGAIDPGVGGTGGGYDTGGTVGVGTGGGYATGGVSGSGGYATGGVWGTGGVGAGGTVATGGSGGSGAFTGAVCNPIAAGVSSVVVDGVNRLFEVQMPADTSNMALLFLWHGWVQVPSTFANEVVYDPGSGQWVPFDPNAFPMPLMIVTPHDTKLIPPDGLDWDIDSGTKDFPFFEGMLQCIQEQFNIDDTRIYSFGFSAGAVFTNLLSAKYPHLFAATISESGAWFNDSTQWTDVLIPLIQWGWPAFDPADGGNVLLTHGGANDFATVISLESTNQKAIPYLYSNGRTVIECAHTFGHTLDPDLTQSMYYDYMWAHQLGGPPLSGMIPGFPTQANPVGATACTFRPSP